MTKNTLFYRDFIGSVNYSAVDHILYGKLEEIDDLVTFEGASVSELEVSFREAVDCYLALCEQQGKEPLKSYRGSFNVRVSPTLHRIAVEKSIMQGISLNQFVQKALETYVHTLPPIIPGTGGTVTEQGTTRPVAGKKKIAGP